MLNSTIAIPAMATPISATIPSDRARGTVQPNQDTPGASACRAAGLMFRWLKTARRIGATM